MRKSLVLGLILALACVACNDDDGGPTVPLSTPNLNGNWVGDWMTEGSAFQVALMLRQDGSRLSGTFRVTSLDSSFPISGSVSNLQMQWAVNGLDCGSLGGDGVADSLVPAQIAGAIDFNLLGCSTNRRFTGPVVWRRSSSRAATSSSSKISTFADLAEALEKELN